MEQDINNRKETC